MREWLSRFHGREVEVALEPTRSRPATTAVFLAELPRRPRGLQAPTPPSAGITIGGETRRDARAQGKTTLAPSRWHFPSRPGKHASAQGTVATRPKRRLLMVADACGVRDAATPPDDTALPLFSERDDANGMTP